MNSTASDNGGRDWAINGRFLTQRVTGVQRYAREIVAALDLILSEWPEIAAQLHLRLVVPPNTEVELPLSRIDVQRTRYGSGHPWDQAILRSYVKTGVLSLGNFGPVLARNHIVCVHDANVFIEPESYSRAFRMAYRTLLPLIGRRAARVATVSQFSADMLVKYGVCRRDKIFIAPNGHEHALRWDARLSTNPLLPNLNRPYVLLLGSRAKHKNIGVILQQAQSLDAAGIDIVVVGAASSIFSADELAVQPPNVHHVGYVSDDDLAALYEKAVCLAFPSKTEGFGIPPLEAMTRGCAVICARAASLVEVGGDVVVYVDPDDSAGWRDAIIGLSTNGTLRATMIEQGKKRAALFSWKRSATSYIDEILRLRPEVQAWP